MRRALHAGACLVAAGQQAAALEQVQPVQRRKAAALVLARQRRGGAPEHRQPFVERRSLAPLGLGDSLDRVGISGLEWIGEDQAEVDVADQLAEAAVGEAAQRVCGKQPVAKLRPVGVDRLQQDRFAVHGLNASTRLVVHRLGMSSPAMSLIAPSRSWRAPVR